MPKKGNGNGLVPRILQGIRDDMKLLRSDLNVLRDDMNRGFAAVRQEMHDGFAAVNARLDGVVEIAGRALARSRGSRPPRTLIPTG